MNVSKHALERIKERKFKAEDLLACLKGSHRRQQIMPNGSIRNWHPTKNVCVVTKDNTVITVMRKEWA